MPVKRVALYPQGLEVSSLVYGAWRLFNPPVQGHEPTVKRLLDLCLEHGITTFDHADIYGSYRCEELFGRCLAPALRPRVELISKCGIRLVSPARPHHRLKSYDTSALHIKQSVEQSLRNLRTDYLDLLLIHRPDPLMDADAVAAAVDDLKQAGKIRAFGVSNFSPAQFDLLQSRCPEPLATNQIEAHPLRSSIFFDGTLDHAQRLRYRPMIWSPLAGGRLAAHPTLAEVLRKRAAELGCGEEALVLAWLQRHPAGLVPVIGTTNEQRLSSMLAVETIAMDSETWHEILQAGMGQEIP
ncbi:MAG TPA: aldo/keto reductase [Oligoflexus sp.]|uniref:aldo/keto reductase n=1 Tax=Oligoflexus sp. TaxID=1971216 RepID=UPI002D5C57BF|nr:aldo/keto reductase [Oligoflexus sp.]HYX38010.1 aldo/keto reductase [Oligoflexus sp.]